jgi:hypothetical protein
MSVALNISMARASGASKNNGATGPCVPRTDVVDVNLQRGVVYFDAAFASKLGIIFREQIVEPGYFGEDDVVARKVIVCGELL